MPADFLTPEQKLCYGRFSGEPSAEQLARYFYLDDADREVILGKRGNHNRLGFAIQLGTVRFLGLFLSNPCDVPAGVIQMMAGQLHIRDISCLDLYRAKESRWDHTAEIRQRYGYRDFTDQPEHFRLVRWLYAQAWLDAERPSVLFDLAAARLVSRKILLPAASALTRLIISVRTRAASRFYRALIRNVSAEQRGKLEALLEVEPDTRQTTLDRLGKPPTFLSGPGLVRALRRLEEIRALGLDSLPAPKAPINRIAALARFALTAKAQAISRMPEDRRLAALFAFARMIEANAHDDALDILDHLLQNLFTRAEQANKKQRLRTIKDLDKAAQILREACGRMMEQACPYQDVRAKILIEIDPEKLIDAMETVDDLTRLPEDRYYPELQAQYSSVRRYMPHVLMSIEFSGTQGARPVLDALEFLKKTELENKKSMDNAPMEVVSRSWLGYIHAEDGLVDRKAYTFCVLDRFQDALSRREIFVPASSRYADPRIGLLDDQAWNATRLQVCRAICRSPMPDKEIESIAGQLDAAYRRVAANLSNNPDVRIEKVDGNDELVITPLDKLEEPPSCVALRKTIASMLPRVDLPELLMEIHQLTGFADEFTHINESESRAEDLHISICAVLLAEACNIGLEPLVRPDVPALTRARLSWVQQNYIRADTLTRANARLVKAQSEIALAQEWGGGHVASVDGIRFVVPVRTINAGPNPKYFNRERGVTYYNMTSDQGTGLNGIIEPGTVRDSMLILAVVLGQQTHLEPSEIMTDTGSYTDIIFAIFWLLGYQFCPRLADMGDARFWRIDKGAEYGPLNGLACNRVNVEKIRANWDDMLRLVGSLKLGLLQPLNLMRTLQKGDKTTELQKALINLGRINKTIYMLNFIDDATFRRRILTQLNTHEGRHSLGRTTFHGRRGELRQRYREGQEDQLGALGLVLNIIVLWNTVYMNAALESLRTQGEPAAPEDIARLSPFGHKHINYLGHYSFILSETIQRGGLRPFHTSEQPWASAEE